MDRYQNAYERAHKSHKIKISGQILDAVAEYGGRFLKQEGAGWAEVEDNIAREKVAHAFRTRRTAADIAAANKDVPVAMSRRPSVRENNDSNDLPSPKRRNFDMNMDSIPERNSPCQIQQVLQGRLQRQHPASSMMSPATQGVM